MRSLGIAPEACRTPASYIAFGVFFILLFLVERGWAFRWVILGLGVISIWRGLWHWTGVYHVDNDKR